MLKLGAAAAFGAPAIVGRAKMASAQSAFAGEDMAVVAWSGAYETLFRDTVAEPFNELYGTRVEVLGGWDQIVSKIQAAPEDNPPYDLTVADEYTSLTGLAEGVFLPTDANKVPNLAEVFPWFYETRPETAQGFGAPFSGGGNHLLVRSSTGLKPESWATLWDPAASGRVTLDKGYWWWMLAIAAVMDGRAPGIDEIYDQEMAEAVFARLEEIKVARWSADGAELARLLEAGEADVAPIYSTDVRAFQETYGDEFQIGNPVEGSPTYVDWYFKVRGTRHGDLADLFLDYMLSAEAQQNFLNGSAQFMVRKGLAAPPHWQDYPLTNDDYHRKFNLLSMDGWAKIGDNYQWYDDRLKAAILKSTG